MAGSSEPLRQAVSHAFGRWQARLTELLRQAQIAGEFAPERDPQPLAAMLLAGWEGALMRSRVSNDLDGLRSFIDLAFGDLLVPPARASITDGSPARRRSRSS
jgi:TetR/AcrR family transcriptional repressor of nem operon